MKNVVGISFNKKGKVYNFDALDTKITIGDTVIVETEKGEQYGYVVSNIVSCEDKDIVQELKPIIRKATLEDEKVYQKNIIDAKKAIDKADEIIKELGLDMRLLDANYTFDRKQLLFNFLADERVDFRELAKRLAQVYRTRIELRQIGARDKAKEIGGLGPCGRVLCCKSFLNDLNSVTINMAKNQMLALNPTKINGSCGRLLCCLGFEDETYLFLKKKMPNIGEFYNKNDIKGKIIGMDIFKRKINVQLENDTVVEVNLND